MVVKFLFVWAFCIFFASCEDIVVTLPNGQIKGSVQTTYRNKVKFYGFIGVPFAAPPVGSLRFMPPQPVANWDGVLETKSLDKICYQVQKDDSRETEDCLYLSVYTPVEPGTNERIPVLVNIYGGTFIHGSLYNDYLKPQNIIEQGIVVVSFNYRLGPFGFLSTGDDVIAGNMGLKDQQMALRWVKDNIHLFGGDPEQVTLIGQSAGAASVTYHLLSPGSAGLFRAAVAQSASALCGWAYQQNPANIAYGIASIIDASVTTANSSQDVLKLLQSVDPSVIEGTGDKYHAFSPVIETSHDGAAITQGMYESIADGSVNKVPLIIGYNSEEEIAYAANPDSALKLVKTYDSKLNLFVPGSMHITDDNVAIDVGSKIRSIYTEGNMHENLTATIKFLSDAQYIRPVIKFADLFSRHVDVFLYQFSYHGEMGYGYSIDGWYGIAHAEDLKYFWTYYSDLSSYPQSDVNTMDRYVTLVSNFAKYLNPTPDSNSELLQNIVWSQHNEGNHLYLNIDTNLEIKQNPREFSYERWVEFYNTYGVPPYVYY